MLFVDLGGWDVLLFLEVIQVLENDFCQKIRNVIGLKKSILLFKVVWIILLLFSVDFMLYKILFVVELCQVLINIFYQLDVKVDICISICIKYIFKVLVNYY